MAVVDYYTVNRNIGDLINYVLDPKKTKTMITKEYYEEVIGKLTFEEPIEYISSLNCPIKDALRWMKETKNKYGKTD